MRLGIVNAETWDFLQPVFPALAERYETAVFAPRRLALPVFATRLNRHLLRRDLASFLRANDVVFFEFASEILAAATRLPKSCGIVARLHRYELYEWAEHIAWDAVDRVIVVSEAKRREFAQRFPDHAAKLVVSRPGVALDRFTPAAKSFAGDLGTLCHIAPRKRVYELILAVGDMVRAGHDLRLHIGGDCEPAFADYAGALEHAVRELGLRDRVVFHGRVADTPAWYRAIDVFISNSYSEGLQVALLEAMASGCFCLSHHWEGAAEALPAANLFFTERELREKIAAHAALSQDARQAARAEMRRIAEGGFSLERSRDDLCAAIDAAAAR